MPVTTSSLPRATGKARKKKLDGAVSSALTAGKLITVHEAYMSP